MSMGECYKKHSPILISYLTDIKDSILYARRNLGYTRTICLR